jgi:glucoamylase
VVAGNGLTIALKAPAQIHWGINGWRETRDLDTRDLGIGVHVADLPVSELPPGSTVQFTFRWRNSGQWQGQDFEVTVTPDRKS